MLLYFILGILFISIGIPLIDNIMSIFSSYTQLLTYKIAFGIFKLKKEMHVDDDEQESKKIPMGFQTSVVGYEIEEPYQEQEEEQL